MKKFKEWPYYKQVTRVYILSLIVSLLFSPIFNKFYIFIFKPPMFGSMFFPASDFVGDLIVGTIFAFYFFLPFFVFWLLEKKRWQVWGVGVIIPALMALNSSKHIFWALILTAIGWLLAQGILLIKKKSK